MKKANQINEVFEFRYFPKTQELIEYKLKAEIKGPYIKVFYPTPENENDYQLVRKTDFDKQVDVGESKDGKIFRLTSFSDDPNNACEIIKTFIYSCWAEAKTVFDLIDVIKNAIDEKSASVAEKTVNVEYKDLISCKDKDKDEIPLD